MNIDDIKDIIIPTKPIASDTEWETEIYPIIQGYAAFWDDEMLSPASVAEIEHCERRLGTTLPEDLKLFYLKFGLPVCWKFF